MSFMNRIRKEALSDEELIKIRESELLFNENRYGNNVPKEEIEEDNRCRDVLSAIKTQAESLLSDTNTLEKNIQNIKDNLQDVTVTGTSNQDHDEIVLSVDEGKVVFKITSN